jgi:tRNA pseudouridine55 synthase
MTTGFRDGILLVDKPAGMTSHDAVAVVRRHRGRIRAGHTGTLDPFATGLLLVALGAATRLIRFIPAEPKVYDAGIAFGASTDTDDPTGSVVARGPLPDESVVRDAIQGLTGRLEQLPPAFSARHVDGRRAYAIARRGGQPDLAPSPVVVHQWQLHRYADGLLRATITCGGGTYIRSLARDLGRACGTAAHLVELRRTNIGPFDVRNAVLPDESATAPLLSPADALAGMPRRELAMTEVPGVRHGRAIAAPGEGTTVALLDGAGALVAIAEREGDWLQPRVVLPGE